MKTINFTIHSSVCEYMLPETSSLTLLKTTVNPDDSEDYEYAFSAAEEAFQREARDLFKDILLPDLFAKAASCSGDDSYYDYIPDYADMLTQANKALGAFDTDSFEIFLNKLNEALHALNAGWATNEE